MMASQPGESSLEGNDLRFFLVLASVCCLRMLRKRLVSLAGNRSEWRIQRWMLPDRFLAGRYRRILSLHTRFVKMSNAPARCISHDCSTPGLETHGTLET
jgi:hypothetical protein